MRQGEGVIVVNGKPVKIELPCTVGGFLYAHGWKATQVVVEHNGEVPQRSQLAEIELRDGDRLEVIVPVAGG